MHNDPNQDPKIPPSLMPRTWWGSALMLLVAVACGAAMPLQARINGEMGVRMGDALAAAAVSFIGSLVIVAAITLVLPSGRTGTRALWRALRTHQLPRYYPVAGLAAAYFVLGMTFISPVVGLALYTVAVVAGQTGTGLVLDRIGVGPNGKQYATLPRIIGTVLTILAVGYAVSPRLVGTNAEWAMLIPVVVLLLGGGLVPFQSALNGRASVLVRSSFPGTLLNYAVGTLVLGIAWLIKFAIDHRFPPFPAEAWLYLGSVLGCVNLIMSALLARYIGLLLSGLCLIAGQLLGALVLDWLIPSPATEIHAETLLGVGLAMVAIIIASIPSRGEGSQPR